MPLLKDGTMVEDPWSIIEKDLPSPWPQRPVILSFELLSTIEDLNEFKYPLGVLFPCDQDVDNLKPYLNKLDLIALIFPTFKDGRAFSQARRIREKLKFTGELRATGKMLSDQYQFLIRTGFTTITIPDDSNLESWKKAMHQFKMAYQPSVLKEPREGLIRKL